MREIINLNQGWKFIREDAGLPMELPEHWQDVDLPHTWNRVDGMDGNGGYYRGRCWYAKMFSTPVQPLGKGRVYVEVLAAGQQAAVYVNGREAAAFGGDCLTVNGYLGSDGITPLLKLCRERDKSIFILVKTSNPSSGELQDRKLGEKTVYEAMAEMCEAWGEQALGRYGYTSVGAVVGATYPEQLKELRTKAPHTFFLVPGYGAQGGGAKDVAHAFDKNGLGAIINSSRGIMCAYKKEGCDEKDYAQAARREALRMKADIMSEIKEIRLP